MDWWVKTGPGEGAGVDWWVKTGEGLDWGERLPGRGRVGWGWKVTGVATSLSMLVPICKK